MNEKQIIEIILNNPQIAKFLEELGEYDVLIHGPMLINEIERIIEEYHGFFPYNKTDFEDESNSNNGNNVNVNVMNVKPELYSILFISRKLIVGNNNTPSKYSKIKIYVDLKDKENPLFLRIIKG
ncbi:MAG: hypothetical protein ACTSRZ_07420 [Promethearchaeota archaeon]